VIKNPIIRKDGHPVEVSYNDTASEVAVRWGDIEIRR
jgi:predicted molibdopterin-dependent oxidoreductase YjgC